MNTYIVIGSTGSGKSFFIKKKLLPPAVKKGYALQLFDINNEYTDFQNNYKFVGIDDFLQKSQNLTNSLILFEEATIFFNTTANGSTNLMSLNVRKRHQNNILIFVFHSLRQVPVYLFDFCNFVTLFKTNDRNDIVFNKYKDNPEIIKLFEAVSRKANEKYFNITLKLY